MGQTLPQKVEPGPIAKALGDMPPEAKFTPTVSMIDFVEERIRSPRMKKLRSVAKKAGVELETVHSWFQDPLFIDWYAERMERSDQFWADEVWHSLRKRALQGKDVKAMTYFLNNRDRRTIKRRQAAAQAATMVATHVTVTLGEPKDPEVRAREVEIQELKVVT